MPSTDKNYVKFTTPAYGQTSSLDVAEGGIHFEHFITYKRDGVKATEAEMIADIEGLRLTMDGREQRDLNGAELIMMEKWKGFPIKDGRLPIRFAQKERQDFGDQVVTAVGLDSVKTVYEVALKSGVVATPSLDFRHVSQESDGKQSTGAMGGLVRHKETLTGSGWHDVFVDIPDGDLVEHLHIMSSNTDELEFFIGNRRKFAGTPEDIHEIYEDTGYTPQAGWVHISEVAINGDLSDAIRPLPRDYDGAGRAIAWYPLKLRLKLSGTETVTILAETIGSRK